MRFIKYYLLFVSALMVLQSIAQEKKATIYTGKIINAANKPLAGVTIGVQEKNRRTISNVEGKFSIKANAEDILNFSKDGFVSTQRSASDATALTVVLQEAKIQGGENDIVEIPFGKRTKRELTYAISNLNAETLPHIPISDVTTLLGGRLSGLYVQQISNGPGNDNTQLQVRGRSTYNSGNSPRFLIDGIYRDITDIDVSEIESVTVLKDAPALAWYGLNAGNGVVMVTTKKGSGKKMSINFESQLGFQQRTNIIEPLSSYDYATLYNEGLTNEGKPAAYSATALQAYQNNSNPYKFASNNYIDSFLKSSSPVYRYALSVSGGSNAFRYFTMLSYYRQYGLFTPVNTNDFNSQLKFQRINFRVNLDYDINKNLLVGLNVGGRSGNLREPLDGATTVLNDLYNLPPNAFAIHNGDGSYGGSTAFRNNPLGRLQNRGYVRNLARTTQVSLTAKQKLDFVTKGLSANLLYSYDAQGNYQSGLTTDYVVVDTNNVSYRTPAPLSYYPANFNSNDRRNELWLGFDYDRLFKQKHQVKASLRFQRSIDATANRLDYRGQQISARVDYGFKNRYFAGFVGSYAGTENFAKSNRYGFFPAVSAAWILSEEPFFKTSSTFNYIKLRGSYGTIGNGEIGGARLPFRTLYRIGSFGYPFGTSFAVTNSADPMSLGNAAITWEKIKKLNVGIDIILLNKSLSLTADYFKDERSDLLTAANLPSILGIGVTGFNGGVVKSKGVETSLTFNKQIDKVNISVNGNYTYAKNEVTYVNEPFGTIDYQSAIGFNTGNVTGTSSKLLYISDGLFQDQNQINNSPSQGTAGTIKPGDIKYRDINGDGVINNLDRISTNYSDIPSSYYGFGCNLTYKIFELSAQFEGAAGRTIQIKNIINSGPDGLNQFSLQRFTPSTASTAVFPRLAHPGSANNNLESDFWLRSGDFLKLRTVLFGISLPEKISSHLHLSNVQLYAAGYNLLNLKKSDNNIDPEMPAAGYGSAYPNLKTFTLGLKVRL
jgi:TonB-linked SusC/RagA family outer membrane protein